MINNIDLEGILINCLKEDLGESNSDYTTLYCLQDDLISKFELLIKEDCIIAGIDIARRIFNIVDKDIVFSPIKKDGSISRSGEVAFVVEGSSFSILKVERTILNIMQRMSGIATVTNEYNNIISSTKAKILDTRKTSPLIRVIDKLAVSIGGGMNHRFGLYDNILIKDNHIKLAGSIRTALDNIDINISHISLKNLEIVVEVSNIGELRDVLSYDFVDRVMLDNFSVTKTKEAIDIIDGKLEVETSGNINKDNILEYAKCGVDYISIGKLTHSPNAVDLSLKVV